jgi:hypothetical protein
LAAAVPVQAMQRPDGALGRRGLVALYAGPEVLWISLSPQLEEYGRGLSSIHKGLAADPAGRSSRPASVVAPIISFLTPDFRHSYNCRGRHTINRLSNGDGLP